MSGDGGASSREFPKPVLVVSRCLGFDACRWDGGKIPFPFLERLKPCVEFRPVCPEMEIGLGAPRDPIRIHLEGGRKILQQPRTGRRLTREMNAFSGRFLAGLEQADGFILKSRSPSCAISDAKIFAAPASENPIGQGAGLFAEKIIGKFGAAAAADEVSLNDAALRARFLTRAFALASFRRARESGRIARLVRYHAENKLLFMARHQTLAREMGRLAANRDRRGFGEIAASYEAALLKMLSRTPARSANVNVLLHALGHFSEKVGAGQKARFLASVEAYRAGEVPLAALLETIGSWAARFEAPWIAAQTFFEPYPRELGVIKHEVKKRESFKSSVRRNEKG